MKIYVLNLIRVKRVIAMLLLIAFSVAVTASLLFVFDTHVLASAEPQVGNEIKTVILDPGHGGEDCGAIGVNGIYEKDLNLSISLAAKRLLEEKGYTVIMTRTEDKMLYSEEENVKGMRKLSDLKNRCKVASRYPDAVLVSIHMNSFGAQEYYGLQVYYSGGSDSGRLLAEKIQQRVRSDVQPENTRSVKDAKNLYILENSPVTAVIVECGFLSNAAECEKLLEKEYQNELSLAIVCGIIDYIEANQQ